MVEQLRTLVLGASLNPDRYSNMAILRLREHGIPVHAFGLKRGRISDVDIDTTLKPYYNIHTVTLYLNAKRQKEYMHYILSLKPKRVIFNPGTEHLEFYDLLLSHQIHFEEACTLVLLSTNQY